MKHFYENENLILIPFAILGAVVLILAIIAWAKFRKLEKGVIQDDELPGVYEDYELSERPFINYFN